MTVMALVTYWNISRALDVMEVSTKEEHDATHARILTHHTIVACLCEVHEEAVESIEAPVVRRITQRGNADALILHTLR